MLSVRQRVLLTTPTSAGPCRHVTSPLTTVLRRGGFGLALLLSSLTLAPSAPACVVGSGATESCTEAALNACLPGGESFDGTVTFNCGGSATITVTATKSISSATSIDGGGLVTISGNNSVGVFLVSSGIDFSVQNLAIANGKGNNAGAIDTSDPGGGTLTVANSTFSGNVSCVAGKNKTVIITNSTFSGNTAPNNGGAIKVGTGTTISVTGSTFSGNSAVTSGGAINNNGPLTVTNCTFSGNSAGSSGGVISNNASGTVTLTNSTFSGNSAGSGAVIGNAGAVTVTNSILADNTGSNCAGAHLPQDGGHNIDDGTTCGFTGTNCTTTTGTSLCNTDPQLAAGLADNGGPTQTIALQAGSPAINAGDENVCAAAPVNNLDQRGFVRPATGVTNCSIGAYEYNSPGTPAPTSTPTPTPTDTLTPAPTPTVTPTSTSTPSGDDCCQCEGSVTACGPPANNSCGSCMVVFHAVCSGSTGLCVTLTPTPTLTASPSPSSTDTPMATPTETPPPSPTTTSAETPSYTATATETPITTATETASDTPTDTPTGTPTDTPTDTPAEAPTDTPIPTATPTSTPTETPVPTPTVVPCVGDCDEHGSVTVDEILTMVNIALGNTPVGDCLAGDANGDGEITVDEILTAVNNALSGCPLGPEQGCLTSGGTVTTATCCASAGDFPDTCAIGACGCSPDASHDVRVCNCGTGCFNGSTCVGQ
jgi:predicted outer membrane repeat protein